MRYPEFLPDYGTLGFVAPSFGCNIEPYTTQFEYALSTFEQLGYYSCTGLNVFEGKGIGISNVPEACAQELTQYYCDDQSDVLISAGGGELMCEILDDVDWDAVRAAKPKWYMGYSDNTNFTFLLNTLCDVAAIYGPCVGSFGMTVWHESIQDAWDLLKGKKLTMTGYDRYETEGFRSEEDPLAGYNLTHDRKITIFIPDGNGGLKEAGDTEVSFSGRLVGGCLDCLDNLIGTKFDRVSDFNARYESDGIIWFLEACDLNVFSIRRAIWQMIHAGWFEHVKGFLIGRPMNGEEMINLDHFHAVTDLLAQFEVPVMMDLDIGHVPPRMPLISGAMADVKAAGQDMSVTFRLD